MTLSNRSIGFSLLPAVSLARQPANTCPRCNKGLPPNTSDDSCPTCIRAEAEAEIWRVRGTIGELEAGGGVFGVLTVGERLKFLRQIKAEFVSMNLGGMENAMKASRDLGRTIERTAELAKTIRTKVETSRTVSSMIKCDRGPAPTPEDREEIEERVHWMEEPERWDGLG